LLSSTMSTFTVVPSFCSNRGKKCGLGRMESPGWLESETRRSCQQADLDGFVDRSETVLDFEFAQDMGDVGLDGFA